jgi:hypothetical protein
MESATPVGQASPRGGAQADTAEPPPGIPSPTYFDGVPTVGALFFTTGTQAHFCTASVVDSAAFDLAPSRSWRSPRRPAPPGRPWPLRPPRRAKL